MRDPPVCENYNEKTHGIGNRSIHTLMVDGSNLDVVFYRSNSVFIYLNNIFFIRRKSA